MSEIDWNHRILCPDGSCNGLVGPDGQCKVCGMLVPNWAEERTRGLQSEPADAAAEDEDEDDLEDDEEAEDEDGDEAEAASDDDEDDDDDEEWSDRKLCDDGACTGVIGANGTCTVCGKQSAA